MLIKEIDFGTPAANAERDGHAGDRRQAVTVPAGTSVMRAADRAPASRCRSCAPPTASSRSAPAGCAWSRSRAARGTPASCTTPVEAGMKVTHPDATAREAAPRRDGALHLRPPARLPDLRRQRRLRAAGHGRRGRPARGALRLRRRQPPRRRRRTSSNPYFTFDPAKCIVCSRCVRACEEVQGTFALTIDGPRLRLACLGRPDEDFLDSECVSCGACVQACPTATLIEKSVIEHGQPERSVVTTCAYCGVGCSFKAEMQGDRSCAWCRTRTARRTTAIPASRAASPGATPPTRTASSSR